MHHSGVFLAVLHYTPPSHSKRVEFTIMEPSQIEQAGTMHVYQRALYQMPERKPQPDGVLDPKLVCEMGMACILEDATQHIADGFTHHVDPHRHTCTPSPQHRV